MQCCASSTINCLQNLLIPVLFTQLLITTPYFPFLWLALLCVTQCDTVLPFVAVLLTQHQLFTTRCIAVTFVVKITAASSCTERLLPACPLLASVWPCYESLAVTTLSVGCTWSQKPQQNFLVPQFWHQSTRGSSASLPRSGSHTKHKFPLPPYTPGHLLFPFLPLK